MGQLAGLASSVVSFFKAIFTNKWFWIVVLIIIAILIIRYVVNKQEETKDERNYIDDLQGDIKNSSSGTATHTESWFSQKALALETAFNGNFYDPTDEDAVYDVFNGLNNSKDVALLISKFGLRTATNNGFTDFVTNSPEQKLTLPQFITAKMDSAERGKINTILSSKGIVGITF